MASSDPDLSTSLAGIPLSTCIYNASGPRSGTSAALQKVAASRAGAVLTKSATLLAQEGNPQPRTFHSADGLASFNSEGLPNNGIDYYISKETIDESMQENPLNKPYIVSLSGKTLADNLDMLNRIASAPTRHRIAAIELNLACPNVIGKPIIGYDMPQMDEILSAVSQVTNLPPLGIKLPPYFDFSHFEAAAFFINKHHNVISYIATINTLGNSLAIDSVSEAPHIRSNHGFAGLSGPAVKYTALANVCKLRTLLPATIDIVGVGGIRSGHDAFEMILAGACAVQVATCHWTEGPGCFDRICVELQEIMREKGYTSIKEFQGKLKDWSKEGAAISRELKRKDNTKDKKETPLATCSNELAFYKTLCGVLIIIVAVLCADWRSSVKLLPTE